MEDSFDIYYTSSIINDQMNLVTVCIIELDTSVGRSNKGWPLNQTGRESRTGLCIMGAGCQCSVTIQLSQRCNPGSTHATVTGKQLTAGRLPDSGLCSYVASLSPPCLNLIKVAQVLPKTLESHTHLYYRLLGGGESLISFLS